MGPSKKLTRGMQKQYPIAEIPMITLIRPSDVRFAKWLFIHDSQTKIFGSSQYYKPVPSLDSPPNTPTIDDRQYRVHGEARLTRQCFES